MFELHVSHSLSLHSLKVTEYWYPLSNLILLTISWEFFFLTTVKIIIRSINSIFHRIIKINWVILYEIFKMKLDNFPVIKLFILSYNLCYANNEIQIDNEDSILSSGKSIFLSTEWAKISYPIKEYHKIYFLKIFSIIENTTVFSKIYPPFIITRRISDNVFDILSAPMQPNTDEENPTVEYIYFCPIESMKDLLKNDQLCRDMQCLFYIDSINVYKDNIRCESEIIPITQTYSGIEIVNHILNSVSVKVWYRLNAFFKHFCFIFIKFH